MFEVITLAIIGFFLAIFDKRPYWRVIKQWGKPFNLKIKYYSRYSDVFECDPDEGIIFISRYNKSLHNKQDYIYSIAHEMGHLIGAVIDEEYPDEEKISERMTKKAIIADEERAWDIARLLLKDAGLYEYHSFKKLREECLATYKVAKVRHHDGLLHGRISFGPRNIVARAIKK